MGGGDPGESDGRVGEQPRSVLIGPELGQYSTGASAADRPVRVILAVSELQRSPEAAPESVTVIPTSGAFGEDPERLVRLARRSLRGTTVVAWLPPVGASARALPRMVRAGAAEVVQGVVEPFWPAIETIRGKAALPDPVKVLLAAGERDLPALLAGPLVRTILRTDQVATVTVLAAHCGVSRATLLRRLRRSLGCTPAGWLQLVRAQLVMHYRDRGLTWDDIAGLVGYSAGTHVRRFWSRWAAAEAVRVSPSVTVRRGAVNGLSNEVMQTGHR